jgi:hypothetical protein
MVWLRRILVHFCAVMLVTPVGWCCWLPTAQAHEQEAEAKSCCSSKAKPAPAKQQEDQSPTRSCCCDPQPAASSAPEQFAKEPVVAVAFLPPVPPLAQPAYLAIVADPDSLHDPSPALHVLHCIWLC